MNTDHDETGQRSGAEAGQRPLTPAQTEWTIPRRLQTGWHNPWWLVEAGLSLVCVGLAFGVALLVPIFLFFAFLLLAAGLALMIAAAQHPPRRARRWLYAIAWLEGFLVVVSLVAGGVVAGAFAASWS